MKSIKIKKKGSLSLHYNDNHVFSKYNTIHGIYFVKRKMSKNLYVVVDVYKRKTWSGFFTVLFNGGKLESVKDFKARAIKEFDKLVKQEDNV